MTKINIYLAGDSTASTYDFMRAPVTGWGQVLAKFLTAEVTVHNHASSGRSSKSFLEEGRLAEINFQITSDDYFIIQFGHNDSKKDAKRHTEPFTSYKKYLTYYIEVARKKGAHPILITPAQRRSFNEEGLFKETHGEYPAAMRELAKELKVPLIDLTIKSRTLYEQLGAEKTKELFLWIEPGVNANYVEGVQDDTHFSETGAENIAQLVVEGFKELNLPLAHHIKNN